MSFLDIVHPDDRDLARETFLQALERGEALGLVLRIKTAQGYHAIDRGQRRGPLRDEPARHASPLPRHRHHREGPRRASAAHPAPAS